MDTCPNTVAGSGCRKNWKGSIWCQNIINSILDVPSKVLLDYMHLVLAGEFLRRLNIWLDSQIDCDFLANKKEEIDEVTLKVKFPHDFHRKLIPLSDLKKWEDRELQNLFLHASFAVSAILPSLLQLSGC